MALPPCWAKHQPGHILDSHHLTLPTGSGTHNSQTPGQLHVYEGPLSGLPHPFWEKFVFFAFCQEDAVLEHLLNGHWLRSPLKLAGFLGPFCSPCPYELLHKLPHHALFTHSVPCAPQVAFYPPGMVPDIFPLVYVPLTFSVSMLCLLTHIYIARGVKVDWRFSSASSRSAFVITKYHHLQWFRGRNPWQFCTARCYPVATASWSDTYICEVK